MPNQRKKGQALIGAYVSEKTLAEVKRLAKREGLTVADYIRKITREKIDQQKLSEDA